MIGLATCRELPEPDPDAAPLAEALGAAGLPFRQIAWDDPGASLHDLRAVLLRSTWNYPSAPEAFLSWIDRVAATTTLWNPAPIVRGNLHKRYLIELAERGVAAVPTRLLPRGSAPKLPDLAGPLVIKPAISAASFGTLAVDADERAQGEAHLAAHLPERDMLIQPFVPSVRDYGERCLIWVDGQLTHAIRKHPRFSGEEQAVEGPMPILDGERALVDRCLAEVGPGLRYARIDMAPGPDGAPWLMELELIEPSLYFEQGPEALERLAELLLREFETL